MSGKQRKYTPEFREQAARLAILVRCLMPMNVQSCSVCAGKTPNYVWTVSF